MRLFCIKVLCLATLIMFIITGSAFTHEWVLKPQAWHTYKAGQNLPISLVSSHVFMKSAELENSANVEASYNGKAIELIPNRVYKSYDGMVQLESAGAAILRGHRKGEVWSKTTKGMKKGDRSSLQGVIESRLYEKFCKTILPVNGKSAGFDRIVGDLLEIVPVDDPFSINPGEDLTVKIIYKGQPISPEVTASYDGFSDNANSYAYFTEPYDAGLAKIKLSAPGLWMVRVQYTADTKGPNYDKHVMRAVLVFPVQAK
jgi:uncharacterized GH25 family protein